MHGDIPFNVTKLVSSPFTTHAPSKGFADNGIQVAKGLSITSWPSGHATDSEDTIRFAQLENINCMVEKFPLEKANEAYGKCLLFPLFGLNQD